MSYRQTPHTNTKLVGTSAQVADYIATGINDETPINQAITDINTAGGGTVLLLPGTYFISNSINLKSNVHLTSTGLGDVAIVIATGFSDNTNSGGIVAAGSDTTGTAITLTADLVDGYNNIQVSTSGGSGTEFALVSNDDWLLLRSTALWESTEQSGRTIAEFVRVNTVSSNSFTIYGMSRSNYLVSDSASLYRETLIESPMVSNIEMYQQAALGTRSNPKPLITFNRTVNARAFNCKLHDSDQAGVLLQYSISPRVLNCHIYQLYDNSASSQFGYAVQVLGSENSRIEGCNIYKVRHGLTTGGGSFGVARGINFIGNTVSLTTNSCVDTHNQSEDVNISGNNINNSVTWAVFARGRSTNIIGNSIEWCGGGANVGLTPYQVSGGSGTGSKIIGNTFRNIRITTSLTSNGSVAGTGKGCILDLTDNCVVQGNTFENIESDGLRLAQKVSKCLIKGNSFLNCNLTNQTNIGIINFQSNITSSAASITTFATPTVTLTYTGTGFANYHVGQTIVISGAATVANNGSFPITAVTANNTLQYSNASAVAPDGNNGTISIAIEQNTDNIFENNFAINTAASIWDPNSTGGHSKYFLFDGGSNTAGSNVRNIFKNNTALSMELGIFNTQNSFSFFANNSNNEANSIKNITAVADDSQFFATPQAGTMAINTASKASYIRTATTNTWNEVITVGANILGSSIQWDNTATSPIIQQASTSTATGQNLEILAQKATGSGFNGGSVIIAGADGYTKGGSVSLRVGTNTNGTADTNNGSVNWQVGQSNSIGTAMTFTLDPNGSTTISAAKTVTAFTLNQTTATATDGYALTIQAQNSSNTSSTGGALALTSGTGTSVAGNVTLQTGGTTRLTVSPTTTTFADSATALTITPLSAGSTVLQFANTATAGSFTYASSSAASTGGAFAITGQSTTLAGTNTTGGAVNITAGGASGASSGTNTGGAVTIKAGAATTASTTNQGGHVQLQAGTGTTANGQVRIVDPTTTGNVLQITANVTGTSSLAFVSTVTAVNWQQSADTTTSSGTGATHQFSAQSNTAATSTGGTLALCNGTGTSTNGNISFRNGTGAAAEFLKFNLAGTIGTSSLPNGTFAGTFPTTITTIAFSQANTSVNDGYSFSITAQPTAKASGTVTGGALNLSAGNATGTSTTNNGGNVVINSGTASNAGTNTYGQIQLNGSLNVGRLSQAITDGATTVVTAANSIKNMIFMTGALTGTRTMQLTVTPTSGLLYFVRNNCTGGSVTVTFSSGTGVTITASASALIGCDGTNAVLLMSGT